MGLNLRTLNYFRTWHNNQMEDEKLMVRYKANDQEAFLRLYEKYSAVVYGYLKKKLPPSEIEDAYQNVWRHLHEKRDNYNDQPFGPWFFTMIKNLIVDQYRSQGRKRRLLESLTEDILISSSNEKIDVNSVLSSLPKSSQDLVKRYFIDGYSYSELEKETGMSQISLRKRLSRVISILKKKSEDEL